MGNLIGKKFSILNHGHVILLDSMGKDRDIVNAARTSYQKGTKTTSSDKTLIRYLMRHRHTSPLESCMLKFHIKLPIFVERQWARHRTAGWNEVSARYSELPEEYYAPTIDNICEQSSTNRQGSGDPVNKEYAANFQEATSTLSSAAFNRYHSDLEMNIAREMARINLPLGTYTEKVWWINLHNLFHFLSLRMESSAQKEIREYATVIGNEIVAKLFPITWEAFVDYQLNALVLSRINIEVIQRIMQKTEDFNGRLAMSKELFMECQDESWVDLKNCRERNECFEKLQQLGIMPI